MSDFTETQVDRQHDRLSTRLRQARQQSGLSQDHVARRLGLSRPSVSWMESGKRRVSSGELAQLAAIYDVSVPWLLAMDDQDPRLERAARELSSLTSDDLDRLLTLLAAMRHSVQKGSGR
jgi:transcriptional regulator with XRE-family HTH domain